MNEQALTANERWLWHVPGESGMYPTTFCICGDGQHAFRYWRSMPTMAWRDDVIADQRSMMSEFLSSTSNPEGSKGDGNG